DDQTDARRPEQDRHACQALRVVVEGGAAAEDEEVAREVSDDEAEQQQAGDRHRDLGTDGGTVEGGEPAHGGARATPPGGVLRRREKMPNAGREAKRKPRPEWGW